MLSDIGGSDQPQAQRDRHEECIRVVQGANVPEAVVHCAALARGACREDMVTPGA
jgi:hypothetical protein